MPCPQPPYILCCHCTYPLHCTLSSPHTHTPTCSASSYSYHWFLCLCSSHIPHRLCSTCLQLPNLYIPFGPGYTLQLPNLLVHIHHTHTHTDSTLPHTGPTPCCCHTPLQLRPTRSTHPHAVPHRYMLVLHFGSFCTLRLLRARSYTPAPHPHTAFNCPTPPLARCRIVPRMPRLHTPSQVYEPRLHGSHYTFTAFDLHPVPGFTFGTDYVYVLHVLRYAFTLFLTF